jgi:hypothetical protein
VLTLPKVPPKGAAAPTWREIVLKKAGIVVAVTAASLLAISPLAFAGDEDDNDDRAQVNRIDADRNSKQGGLINIGDVNALNDVNVCPNVAAAVGLGNLLGILGANESEASSGDVVCVNDDTVTQFNDNDD